MKKIKIVVTIVTLYLIFFQVSPFIGISDDIIFTMFCISPCLVIYIVLVILKNGEPSKYTFDERFYDDLNYERNGTKQIAE
jgi:hypothetical protein